MNASKSVFIAVGGGEMAESHEVLDEFIGLFSKNPEARVVVFTVATNNPEKAAAKYNYLFRSHGVRHVDTVDVSTREDSFSEASVKKIGRAHAMFFTGGDQLNITSLLGGSPVYQAIRERVDDGIVIAGTSAGAAMMSKWMITTGDSDHPPKVGSVEMSPGMDLWDGAIIDTHFSQRGRHGRLLTAVAHFPQALGVGIDERTGIVIRGMEFTVVGEGSVTVIDGGPIRLNDLPYKKSDETIAISGAVLHALPSGYKFHVEDRAAEGPRLTNVVGRAEK